MDRQTWIDIVRPLVLELATKHDLRFTSLTLDAALEDIGGGAGHSFTIKTEGHQQLAAVTHYDLNPKETVFYICPSTPPALRANLQHLAVRIAEATRTAIVPQGQLISA